VKTHFKSTNFEFARISAVNKPEFVLPEKFVKSPTFLPFIAAKFDWISLSIPSVTLEYFTVECLTVVCSSAFEQAIVMIFTINKIIIVQIFFFTFQLF
jgi:hypothetical protein